jgi:hypothetical protein
MRAYITKPSHVPRFCAEIVEKVTLRALITGKTIFYIFYSPRACLIAATISSCIYRTHQWCVRQKEMSHDLRNQSRHYGIPREPSMNTTWSEFNA